MTSDEFVGWLRAELRMGTPDAVFRKRVNSKLGSVELPKAVPRSDTFVQHTEPVDLG